MAIWECQECGKEFERNRLALSRPVRFCTQRCYHKNRAKLDVKSGTFKKGNVAWNKDTKGVMKPNKGSFKKGGARLTILPIGTVTIRTDKNSKKRAWVKIADNGNVYDWKPRAVKNWEDKRGKIPNNMIVHHKDRNTLNDRISNLELKTRSAHMLEHLAEIQTAKQ